MRRPLAALATAGGLFLLSGARAETSKPAFPVYRSCPPNMVWREQGGGCLCASGFRWDETAKRCTTACPPGKVQAPGASPGTCVRPAHTCPPGKRWSELHGGCVVVCPAGKAADAAGTGCVSDTHGCPADTQWYESRGACLPFCAPGKSLEYKSGACVDDEVAAATPPSPPAAPAPAPAPKPSAPPPRASAAPKPAPRPPSTPKPCPEGKEWKDAFDGCVPICPDGQVLDFYGIACHPIRSRR